MKRFQKIHFVGIGGIGTSALARFFLLQKNGGMHISGSDLVRSGIVNALEKLGAKIFIGPHSGTYVNHTTELLIHTPAIDVKMNPEIKKAKSLGIPIQSYPEALGELSKHYTTIAISGSHGKSTTTALISLMVMKAGLDPTVIIGTKVKEFGNPALNEVEGSNCRIGKSKYLVIEADEWGGSFLHYWPSFIVLTNIEKEHMDYFHSVRNIERIFLQYFSHLKKTGGILIVNYDSLLARKIAQRFVQYGGTCRFYSLRFLGRNGYPPENVIKKYLSIPGMHNVSNALGALTLGRLLGISNEIALSSWKNFTGTWRRFEILNPHGTNRANRADRTNRTDRTDQPIYISDYAHHPTEIRATLHAAREKFDEQRPTICLYQPHQYQRTHYLFHDFVKAFDEADVLLMLDVYDVTGREKKSISKKVDSKTLVKAIQCHCMRKRGRIRLSSVHYIPTFDDAYESITKYVPCNAVVFIMGAGNIVKISDRIKRFL